MEAFEDSDFEKMEEIRVARGLDRRTIATPHRS